MCGLVGFMNGRWASGTSQMPMFLMRMAGRIAHRGPDHADHWLDPDHQVALAHRRLAIVDLSPAGDQPMASPSGRYVIVYNGEIYNHLDLRRQLEEQGHSLQWRGHSDTETLLACIEAWGLELALQRSIGMFAFALWDRSERRLALARDRLGEKPLYYGWQGQGRDAAFLFGSELKALACHPAFAAEIDRDALALYMRHNSIPAPYSIYRGIAKVLPGTFITLSPGQREPVVHRYWSGPAVAEAGVADRLGVGPHEAVDELEKLLMDAIGKQMLSDVPLGAFLSGGIDSSTVVALMQAQSSRPVKTFSIGFHEEGYNEAVHAKAVAQHLGTDHTELYVSPEEAMAVIPRLAAMYDEPFADSSQIPTFLVSQLARRHVTVALSGDAGDELFGGYDRYTVTGNFWKYVSAVPAPIRRATARGITSIPPRAWTRMAKAVRPVTPRSVHGLLSGDKMHKAAGVLASKSVADLYRGVVSHWRDPASLVIDGREPPTWLTGNQPPLKGLGDIERMMALDLITYLPDDILVKVDRAAMAVSLETRVPFLDHRVVEMAWRLPMEYKLRDGQSKWALRQVLYRHVPKALLDRPKAGFGIPLAAWLRGPLREWAEDLLSEERLRRDGYFRPEPIRALWKAHQAGQVSLPYHLWDVLMFQSWLDAWKQPDSLAAETLLEAAPAAA
jgi:asparagine synthase (glutamine-hydrolysing)